MVLILCQTIFVTVAVFLNELFVGITKSRKAARPEFEMRWKYHAFSYNAIKGRHPKCIKPARMKFES